MFVNKISNNYQTFKGLNQEKNITGRNVFRFNYPLDYNNKEAYIEIFRVMEAPKARFGYNVVNGDKPIYSEKLKREGIVIDLDEVTDLDSNEPFAYRISIKGEMPKADTGMNLYPDKDKNRYEYTLVTRNGSSPSVQGPTYITMKDSHAPGIKRYGFNHENAGEIYEDKEAQKLAESTQRTYANKFDGSLAGIERDIPTLAKLGYTSLTMTPIIGGDDVAYHGYWNKNNFAVAGNDNIETFTFLIEKAFQYGLKFVYDATLTSEGIEGINLQYAMRWLDKDSPAFHLFRMERLENGAIELGIVPRNDKNLDHKVINPKYIAEQDSDGNIKIVENKKYNPNKETYFQQFDSSQASKAQAQDLETPIRVYKNSKQEDKIAINSHSDTVIPFVLQIDPEEHKKRLEVLKDFNKDLDTKDRIRVHSPEGTMMIGQFSNFKIGKVSAGIVEWDANVGLEKRVHANSNYDEKLLKSLETQEKQHLERIARAKGGVQNTDMDIQTLEYWGEKIKDIIILYIARNLKGTKTSEELETLIANRLLPQRAYLEQDKINAIQNGYYNLAPKGQLDKDSTTVRALMKLPLPSLEVGENIQGVLSSPFFSQRVGKEDLLGKTRFELMQEGNPHLEDRFAVNYLKMNYIFKKDLRDFAHEIISKIDEKSPEKLLKSNGEYTEFGEYVIENFGPKIARHALLKAMYGKDLPVKTYQNGKLMYDYETIKNSTTLMQLGIRATNPDDEASDLLKVIQKGLYKLSDKDVNLLVDSITKQLAGVDTNSFRIAEAIYYESGLGMDVRLDALKDTFDQDSVRSGDHDFMDIYKDNLISYWEYMVKAILKHNPSSSIIAEITDISALMEATFGTRDDGVQKAAGLDYEGENDAVARLLAKTGITTEAAYSHFFTSIIRLFSNDFENGVDTGNVGDLKNSFRNLINTRSADYIRNMLTFIGNHDKPRAIHMFAINPWLFFNNFDCPNKNGGIKHEDNRWAREQAMLIYAGVDKIEDLPLELKLNIDNVRYFQTVSSRALSMVEALKRGLESVDSSILPDETRQFFKKALSNLIEGKYLSYGEKVERQVITLPELSTIEGALCAIFDIGNNSHSLKLSENEKSQIIAKANELANNNEKLRMFMVREDIPVGENIKTLATVLNNENPSQTSFSSEELAQYSLYTISLAALLREAVLNSDNLTKENKESILKSISDFVKKYDNKTVLEKSKPFPYFESEENAMRKNGFAACDFDTTVEMLVKEAEYLARKDKKLAADGHFEKSSDIFKQIYTHILEPAVQKYIMAMTLLSALPGCVSFYYGDEYGMSGGEDKTKNNYHKNREARKLSRMHEGVLKEFTQKVNKLVNDVVGIRKREGTEALNSGTPYMLEVGHVDNGDWNKVAAWMMQDGHNNINICIANLNNIAHDCNYNYLQNVLKDVSYDDFFKDGSWDSGKSINPANPKVPIQRHLKIHDISLNGFSLDEGMEFLNTNSVDKDVYVVKILNGIYKLVKKGAEEGKFQEIIMNGNTTDNGVMILKHVSKAARRIAHKGRSQFLNKQYNIVTNPYQRNNTDRKGLQLSIISK